MVKQDSPNAHFRIYTCVSYVRCNRVVRYPFSDVNNWTGLASRSAVDRCTAMETSVESGEDGPVYTLPQIKAAWRLMCRGEKEGLRKRDIGTATAA